MAAALAGPVPAGWRWVDPASWHVTLAFHGDADPVTVAAAVDATSGMSAPRLRIDGTGSFPGVRFARVVAEPVDALLALVAEVGGDADGFVPHVTVLRRRGRGHPEPPARLPRLTGPWWQVDEVVLMASERRPDGPVYSVVHRVALAVR
jgi:RNA 2',3'-cyclic 3'-phosphodiesterase